MVLTPTFAENVDLTQAQHVAQSFLQSKMGQSPDIHLIDYSDRASFSHFYVFGNDNCFVIVSADDRVTPIIGYSTENAFGQTTMPENVFGWLKAYDDEVGTAISRHMDATDEIQSEWSNLLNGNGLEPLSRTSVSPLLLTMWDQTEPYNNLCPSTSGGPGNHSFAGCVATAMAQVMNYWEHPVKGTGNHSYNCPNFGNLSANFATTTYDWDHMKNSYSMGYTSTEATAVATLMYHCGVSVDMAYGVGNAGSAAYTSDVANALKTYFNYATTTQYYSKSSYNDTQWINMLKTELDNGRPVIYTGQSSDGGHSFVCDGYNENNQFHFNWGWSGYCNGYYAIGALNPGPGGSGSGSQGQYNAQNGAIFGCEPITPSINPPTNVNSSVNGRNVTVTWTAASSAVSYKVYRDGNLIAGSVTGTSYTDSNVTYGDHVYYLKSVASNGAMSLQSATTTANVHFAGPVPTNLQGTPSGSSANLTWNAPASETTILQYGTGSMVSAVGYSGNTGTYWAQRYPASTLAQYAGMAINKVSVYFYSAGSYTLYIYKGNETGTTELVQQKSYSNSGSGWKDITLTTPAPVDYTQDLWVVMYAPSSINYPATFCSYSGSGVADARYISYSGDSWAQHTNTNTGSPNISWLMKTYMTDGTYTYRVYRNNSAVATNVSGTTYTDNNLASGTYNYYVTTNYYGGESDASNTVSVVIDGTQTYNITVSADPTAGGNVTGGGSYNSGQSCTVTASANTGYTFVNWTENGTQVSTSANYTFTVNGNRNLVAHFQQQSYTITVSADPTTGGSVSGGGTFNHGQSCTVHATANTGYTFINWTENGTQVSTNANYTFTVNSNRNLVAHFQQQSYTITVSADPTAGGSVSGGGTFNHGQSCTVHATANTGYTFINWTENGTQVSTNANYTFTVNGNRNLVAHFQLQTYNITVSADPTAGGNVTGGGTYTQGQSCTVTATANTGYTFINWTENGSQVSTNANYTFTVNSNRTLVAHFSTQSYVITAMADPAEGGTVSGSGGYNYGDNCTLTATANTGYTFVNWTKNGTQVSTNASYTFTVTETATYVAHFQIQSYTITVAANPEEGGSVSGGGSFNYGQSCTVHAMANEGYNFVNWTENDNPVSNEADYTFTVEGNRELVANFSIGNFVVTAITDPENGGSITGTGSYDYGETCTLSIEPYENYTFINWTEDGEEVSTEPTFSFTVEGNRSFVAHLLFYDGLNETTTPIELYPNPADDWLHIMGEGLLKVVVVNTLGQVIESAEIEDQGSLLLNVKHYEPATYIITVYTENGIVTRRFVKR